MASKVEIMNVALLQLGDEVILTDTEDTKAARVMTALWATTVREVLEDHTWGFAKKRATLALLGTAPEYEFDHAYQLPSDYVRMVTMGEEDDEYTWRIEGDQLLTNEDTAEIVYIYYVTDTGKFSAKFVSALACLLAAKAANTLAGLDTAKSQGLMAVYEKLVMDGATVDSQNSPSPVHNATRWINARY